MCRRDRSLGCDGHRRNEGRQKPRDSRIVLQGSDLIHHLQLDIFQPLIGIHFCGIGELLAHQLIGLRYRGQRLEEFDTTGEFVDGDPGKDRLHHHGRLDADQHAERSQFAESEANLEALVHDQQLTFQPNEEHAVSHRRVAIEGVNHVAGCVDAENSAQQHAGDFCTGKIPADFNRNGFEIGDRELALHQQTDIHPQSGD